MQHFFDLSSAPSRIQAFRALAQRVDEVIVTLGCSDSRVRFPSEPVTVHSQSGTPLTVLFLMIPTIGGGAPSRSRLRRVVDTILSWGVAKEKIRILVTQHGDTHEVQERLGKYGLSSEPKQLVSCGLRNFFGQFSAELSQLHSVLTAFADRYKQQENDRAFLLDALPLTNLELECPEAFLLITELAEKTRAGKFCLPRRLILRAAYRNTTFDIEENGQAVRSKIAEHLRESEFADIFASCTVGLADYDHNKKTLTFASGYTSLLWHENHLSFPQLPTRNVPYQDPKSVLIVFGQSLLTIPDAILSPELCHMPDATFRSCVTTPQSEILLCGLAEGCYAILHHLIGHDHNFEHLERVIVLTDSRKHLAIAENITHHPEYQSDFAPLITAFSSEGLQLVHLDSENVAHKLTVIS